MKIEEVFSKDKKRAVKDCLKIARKLKEWFSPVALANMKNDLKYNNLIVAIKEGEISGFLCWNSENGIIKIVWLAVEKIQQGKKIGSSLLKYLEKRAKKMGAFAIDVQTLTDKESYEPYRRTREFYYRKKFKKLYEKKARIKKWDDEILMSKKLI